MALSSTGANLTCTPLTSREGNAWRQIGVNTLINTVFGALIAWTVTKQPAWQGAALGGVVTLFIATVGAGVTNVVNTRGSYLYGQATGLVAGAYVLTHWKGGGMQSFRLNVIYAVAIYFFTPVGTTIVANITDIKV